jgi:hypothetical protein
MGWLAPPRGTGGDLPLQAESPPRRAGNLQKPGCTIAKKKVHAVFDDIEFDDALIAKMMANMASHGMSAADTFG